MGNNSLTIMAMKTFTPLEIMPRCSAAGLHFRLIPAGFNAPLEFLTGFTGLEAQSSWPREKGAVALGLTPQALRHYFLRRCPLDAYRSDRP
jgi:hypothetical protein